MSPVSWMPPPAAPTERESAPRAAASARESVPSYASRAAATVPGDPAPAGLPGSPDDAVRELRPADREILIETYFRGRTVAEAAARLNLPLDTARLRTYLALRAILEQRHR